jgi:hypothetical protein
MARNSFAFFFAVLLLAQTALVFVIGRRLLAAYDAVAVNLIAYTNAALDANTPVTE